jgi:hypothetical protein
MFVQLKSPFQNQPAGARIDVSDTLAALWTGLGHRAISTTHPAMIRSRLGSPHWQMTRPPSFAPAHEGALKHATTRLTAGFRYVGPPLTRLQAERLLGR